uniref:hypothetical protein n=1 Tax=Cupriavidus taiwanensis TaxID=164546 RepID=UPI001F11E2AA|nr:hypothetical protein [Cupriavidus taiwanensis]
MLYLLTSPFSNIVGVYQIVPRIAAAEMGWTSEQLVQVLDRLADLNLIAFDEKSGWVWVKIWWEHHSAKMATAPSLRASTCEQIKQIVPAWRDAYVADFVPRVPTAKGWRDEVHAAFQEFAYEVATPCPHPVDTGPANTNYKNNFTDNTNTGRAAGATDAGQDAIAALEFPSLAGPELAALQTLIVQMPQSIRQDVLDEIEGKRRAGRLKGALALCGHFRQDPAAFVLTDGKAVQRERSSRRQAAQREADFGAQLDRALLTMSDEELQRHQVGLPRSFVEKVSARRHRLRHASAQEKLAGA